MNAIELSHVCKHFPGFSIQDLTFAVPSGTICGLVGENGAGKSTTIRLLMGALRPDSGTCSALGVDTSSPEFLAIKEDVGVVLDEAYFPEVLNADQVGRVMTRTYQRWDAKVYAAYLRRFDLPLKKAFKDFSRGMRMATPADRTDVIEECRLRMAVYAEFAPARMDEAAIREVIEATLTELGLDKPTAKDKGKLMKALMPKVKDKADGALVNRLVGTYLK